MYIVYIWPTGVAGGRAVPPDVMADGYLQCLTTLVMGGNGLSRPGEYLGFRDLGFRDLGFRV